MTRYGCKLVLPSPGVKYKCGEIRVLFALGQALVFLTANGREATRRERWYSFSGEGGRRPDEGENPRMLFCKSNAFSLSPALSRGRGSWEHRPSTFLVRCSILVICRSMVELLAYGRGEFHLAPNQKQNGARWNLPSRIFLARSKDKKKTLPGWRVFERMWVDYFPRGNITSLSLELESIRYCSSFEPLACWTEESDNRMSPCSS